jgi:hypothetical protein
MRGRPFGFLGTLCVVWITSRIGFLSLLPALHGQIASRAQSDHEPAASVKSAPASATARTLTVAPHDDVPYQLVSLHRQAIRRPVDTPSPGPRDRSPPATPLEFAAAAPTVPQADIWSRPERPTASSGFDIYVYSFFRSRSLTTGLDGGGRYGGSQSGFVASYALARDEGLAAMVRGAIAHDRIAERELAAGLRMKPFGKLPLSITAEHRFRNDQRDAFAVYLAGGISGVALPARFNAEGFAQAGVVSDKRSGTFFDFAARAERPLTAIDRVPVTAGAGVWGGGQRGVFRIDAGPTIGTEIPLGKARLRVSADWRFRVAGDASPAGGPALTLSTGF